MQTRKSKTLAEWQAEQKNRKVKVPKNIEMKNEFKETLKKFDEKNLRFFYFRNFCNCNLVKVIQTRGCCTQGVTAATVLNRNNNKLKIAFSFCDPKDSFCKIEGKLEALKRLVSPDKFVTEVDWSGDSLVDVAIAFNKMEKPVKFMKWKFLFQVILTTKRIIKNRGK